MAGTPVFYKPVFGNDNMNTNRDVVDIAAFTAPAMKLEDAAIVDQIKKRAEVL